jgi:hypothetical protein
MKFGLAPPTKAMLTTITFAYIGFSKLPEFQITIKSWPGFVGQLFVILKWYPAHHYAAASSLGSVSQ